MGRALGAPNRNLTKTKDENSIRNSNLDQEDLTCQKVTRSAGIKKRRNPKR